MADWSTVASLATAAGTLVLAVATFASVRSGSRTARVAERALLAGLRPVLAPARLQDPPQKVGFADGHFVIAEGGHAVAEATEQAIYLAIAVRNVGSGLAVLHGWQLNTELLRPEHGDTAAFRRLTRDIYVAAGDVGFWQGAVRDPQDPLFAMASGAIDRRKGMAVEVLYGDHEGGQRTITRFALFPTDTGGWLATVGRYWNLDRPDPR